jgi:hypothetical protein
MEERPTMHRSYLPQKVVQREVWTWGFQLQMIISMERDEVDYSPK